VRARRPDLQLVVAGAPVAWAEHDLVGEGVRALGFVPDADLPALYRGASALAYPSLLEGFGIPVVEAMASGTPVVTSSHPSLDDAAGDAAVRADPRSPAAIASAIERVLAERERLVPLGLEHARRFTWKACGEALLAGYERAGA
jgi:glycosyltransferase involved in cell wall biosynthesis